MTFVWPAMLWLLLAVPAFIALYVLLLRRRRKAALRYASLSMVKGALGREGRFRRHLPPLLFLLALSAMIVAVARPTAVMTLPSEESTIILALDVSGSMRAPDVEPTRLAAAQAAAREFVAKQPRETRTGVVAFAASASLVQAPTQHREDIDAAIDRLQLQYGTAVGSGILVSLATLFPDADIAIATVDQADGPGAPVRDARVRVPPGSHDFLAVILLTDGQTTTGPDPIEAARIAADYGVRVFTVGMGTAAGEVINFEGWSMRVGLDEDTLKTIAQITRGEYFQAQGATELMDVYRTLNARLSLRTEQTEVSALFAGAGALLALLAAALSLLWFNRIL